MEMNPLGLGKWFLGKKFVNISEAILFRVWHIKKYKSLSIAGSSNPEATADAQNHRQR